MSNFDTAFGFIMGPSLDGHLNDSAPGETFQTKYGVTYMTYKDALLKRVVTKPWAQVQTADDVKPIYQHLYWDLNGCNELPPAVAMVIFVDATLMGDAVPKEHLQELLGVTVDGDIGPETDAAAGQADPAALERQLAEADLAYLKTLPNWPRFANGWTSREEALMAAALKLV